MTKDGSIYLRHIADAIGRVEAYTKGMSPEGFMGSDLVQAGVIRELEVIGEATKHVSAEIKEKYPDVPWKQMAGTRDKLIHQYFGVDLQVVWDTVEQAIPVLKARIEEILRMERTT